MLTWNSADYFSEFMYPFGLFIDTWIIKKTHFSKSVCLENVNKLLKTNDFLVHQGLNIRKNVQAS